MEEEQLTVTAVWVVVDGDTTVNELVSYAVVVAFVVVACNVVAVTRSVT